MIKESIDAISDPVTRQRIVFRDRTPGRIRVTQFSARPLLQIAVLFDEYLDEVHLPVVPFRLQQLAFRTLARLGRRRGYGSVFPEYAAEQLDDATPKAALTGVVEHLHGKVETAGVEPAPPR